MTITRSTIDAIIADLRSDDADTAHDALLDLGQFAGKGMAANESFADGLAGDYICALDDGTIVAWGGDRSNGRDVVFIDPSKQV